MREPTIYIPTYRRTGAQETLNWISPAWWDRVHLVAAEDEVAALAEYGVDILICPVQGRIGDVRQWIIDQHDMSQGSRILMLDDDLKFFERRTDDPTKFVPIDEAGWDTIMDELMLMLDVVPLCGVVNRSGANRYVEPYRLTPRVGGTLAIDLDVVRRHDFTMNRIRFMEDFDFALQFLSMGYPTLGLNTHVFDQRGGSNARGGCSTSRDQAAQSAAAHRLAAMWPDFVSTREAPGWAGEMAGTRTDVRVAWRRALDSGRTMRAIFPNMPPTPKLSWDLGILEKA